MTHESRFLAWLAMADWWYLCAVDPLADAPSHSRQVLHVDPPGRN